MTILSDRLIFLQSDYPIFIQKIRKVDHELIITQKKRNQTKKLISLIQANTTNYWAVNLNSIGLWNKISSV